MSFTVSDYHDLVQLLSEHPEWRSELRHLLFSDELLTLPEIVRELAFAQRRTEERLEELAETVRELASDLRRLTDTVGELKGDMMEIKYREKIGAYFGRLLRRAKAVEVTTLEDTLEEKLSREEFEDLLLIDLIVSGYVRYVPESPEVYLAVEVSSVVDVGDVSRAVRRAKLLERGGYSAVPAVAGDRVTQGGRTECEERGVALVQDGRVEFWEEAVTGWRGIELEG